MLKGIALGVFLTFALAGPALAFQCPTDVAAIDKALSGGAQLSEADMSRVKSLRDEGAAAHADGKHQEALDKLNEAKGILGL